MTYTALVNAGRVRAVRTAVKKSAVSATVERELLRSSAIAPKLEFSRVRVFEVLRDHQLHAYNYSRRAHMLLPDDQMHAYNYSRSAHLLLPHDQVHAYNIYANIYEELKRKEEEHLQIIFSEKTEN